MDGADITFIFQNFLRIDSYCVFLRLFISLIGCIGFFVLFFHMEKIEENKVTVEIPFFFGFSILFLNLLSSSNDFFVLFLFLEAISFISIFFIVSNFSKLSVEAGTKYFIINAIATGILLFGILLIYSSTASTNFSIIKGIIHLKIVHGYLESSVFCIYLGSFFIVLGFFFKIGSFPFTNYVPDAYEASSYLTIFFLSVLIKFSLFFFLLRLLFDVFIVLNYPLSILLYVVCIGSLVIGCLGALIQTNLKRFIAYSSITQLGFLLSGLACFDVFILKFIIIYVFIYLLSFIVFLVILDNTCNSEGERITDISQLRMIDNPAISIILSLCIFSMMGLPPLSGFFIKYFLFIQLFKHGLYFLFFFVLLTSVVSCFYYLVFFSQLFFFDKNSKDFSKYQFKFSNYIGFSKRKQLYLFYTFALSPLYVSLIFYFFDFYYFGDKFFESFFILS